MYLYVIKDEMTIMDNVKFTPKTLLIQKLHQITTLNEQSIGLK